MSDKKSLALSAEMADELSKRLTGLAVVEEFDANGNPVIKIGPGTAGGRNAVLITKVIDWPLAKDVLGLPARGYNPHVIQVVTEANPSAGAGADPLTVADEARIMQVVTKRGTRVERYESAAGVAPTAAAAIAGNLKVSIEADLYWTSKASQ